MIKHIENGQYYSTEENVIEKINELINWINTFDETREEILKQIAEFEQLNAAVYAPKKGLDVY